MKIQPLYDLQQEINRLYIAGSKFAKGDPRIEKHIVVFNKLGEKVPVFKKLATDLDDLTKADIQQSAEKLMSISTLLYSILYTQGEPLEEGVEPRPQQPEFDIDKVDTTFSYLQLKPTIEALTTSNQGRLEVVSDAFDRGIFKDFRTYPYLSLALADKYSEIANLVELKIIPSIGKVFIPFLLQKLVLDDKSENVRRVRLLGQLGYKDMNALVEKIFADNLPNMQAATIKYLCEESINEEFIINLADDKNKVVRETAYQALADLGTKASLEKLKNVYVKNKKKGDGLSIVAALSSTTMPYYFDEVLAQLKKTFQDFISLPPSEQESKLSSALEKLHNELPILSNKDYPEVYAFIYDMLCNEAYNNLIKARKNILSYRSDAVTINQCLDTLDKKKSIELYEKLVKDMPDEEWNIAIWKGYFWSCIKSGYSTGLIYDKFVEAFKKEKITPADLYEAYVHHSINYYNYQNYDDCIDLENIDLRWLPSLYDLFYGRNVFKENNFDYTYGRALVLLDVFEPVPCMKLNTLLVDCVGKCNQRMSDVIPLFILLMRRKVDNRFELIYETIKRLQNGTYFYALERLSACGFWTQFPRQYADKFRKIAAKSKMSTYSNIADEIEQSTINEQE